MKKHLKLLEYLLTKKIVSSQDEALQQVMAGNVISSSKKFNSLHEIVTLTDNIYLKNNQKQYVSRGGEKIDSIFELFELSASNKSCLDCGASTGGFTDFLLQKQANYVITLDVNYGMLSHSLRISDKVFNLERINIKELDFQSLSKSLNNHPKNIKKEQLIPVDFLVADLSFISLRQIIPVVRDFVKDSGDFFVLYKPQFEAPKDEVPSGGVITSDEQKAKLIAGFKDYLEINDFIYLKHEPSKVKGSKGNQEYFFHFQKKQ